MYINIHVDAQRLKSTRLWNLSTFINRSRNCTSLGTFQEKNPGRNEGAEREKVALLKS